jgi:tRNA (guanine-N7-)-methyltransferase
LRTGRRGPSRPRVDNASRTAEHLARMAERRAALEQTLAGILSAAGRLVWEVGSGHGHFLTAYAQAHRDELCVGVDVILERIARATRKRDRAQLTNLHFIRGDAKMFLEALPKGVELAAVYVLFPDPWPKLRHHKHRLMQADFLTAVAGRAGQGTRFYFRTDHEPYFVDAEEALRSHPAWELVDEAWPFEERTVFQARAPSFRSLVAVRR